jgi:hypothetical protein
MTASGHSVPAKHPARLRLMPVIAGAKRAVRQHPVLIGAAVLVLWGGGVAGGVLALNSSTGFQAAALCPGAHSFVYAVPSYPAQRAPTPAWPPGQGDYWGWMVRRHPLKVGDRVRAGLGPGSVWQVKAIAALLGDCQFIGVSPPVTVGGSGPRPLAGGTVSGQLVLQPVG